MSSIREEEASKYTEEVELNTQSSRTVDKALSKISGSKTAFLQRQSLEPDSGYVVGLLKGIKDHVSRVELIEAQRIYDEEQDSSKDMFRMKGETAQKCDAKTGEYNIRKEDQKKEREAIVEATALLKQEEAGRQNAAGATSFLQAVSKKRDVSGKKDLVRKAVALMQHQTKEKAKGMDKAAEAVLGLVEAIRNHQTEDTKRTGWAD
eukprot:g856.t1